MILGDYELHEKIGEGGFAVVHVGRKRGVPGFSPIVAIKRLKPALAADRNAVAALVDEARTSSCVHHPNVVRTLDVTTDRDEVLLVLELVVGTSLARLVRAAAAQGERVPPPIACAIVAGALRGLAAAHEARRGGELVGLVHRDVSPENILVDEHGTAKLADFGIARARGRLVTTAPDVIKGKLRYMAPEYLRGEGVDARADVHAIGVVLWEVLTSRAAFDGDEEVAIRRICAADLAAPSTLADVPTALDRVVAKSVTRTPSERYESARAMLADLEAALPHAAAREVAEWVARISPAEVARLRDAISTLERDATRVDVVVEGQRPLARRRRVLLPLLALTLMGATAIAIVRARGASPRERGELAPPPTTTTSSGMPPLPNVAASGTPTERGNPSAGVRAEPPRVPAVRHGTGALSTRPRPCDPAWTVDEKGIKHYKDECL